VRDALALLTPLLMPQDPPSGALFETDKRFAAKPVFLLTPYECAASFRTVRGHSLSESPTVPSLPLSIALHCTKTMP
jgi:hypothetical protein